MRDAGMVVFDLAYESQGRVFPVLQPGANRAYMDATDTVFSRFLISADLLTAVLEKDRPASPYEVMRRAAQELRRNETIHSITHVAAPLLRVRDLSTEIARQRNLLVKASARRRLASAATSPFTVSIVICTKDRAHLLMQLVDNLRRYPPEFVVDIAIVANRLVNDFALACHAELGADRRIRIIDYDRCFNFSDQCNIAAKSGAGELILFINDDIVPIGQSWLPELAQGFVDDRIAVAGPQLLYGDELVQHAGMYLGFRNCAGHTLRRAKLPRGDYLFTACATRHVTAVTGAVLLTRRRVFEQVNGFDRQLGTYLQDVDFCLRVLNLDMDIVYNPYAALFHMESSSMIELSESGELLVQRQLEYQHFTRKWESFIKADPFHNPNFHISDERLLTLAVAS